VRANTPVPAPRPRLLPCPLVAVHAWIINTNPVPLPYLSIPSDAADERNARAWLDDELDHFLPGDEETTIRRLAPYGPAARVLLEEAGPDDLLVLGTRGHGGFGGLLLGSVAMQCAAHARGPVVVVKASS
jgi:nucleotide-binding universal stress UspA family protein